jgi:hypothetical protein
LSINFVRETGGVSVGNWDGDLDGVSDGNFDVVSEGDCDCWELGKLLGAGDCVGVSETTLLGFCEGFDDGVLDD